MTADTLAPLLGAAARMTPTTVAPPAPTIRQIDMADIGRALAAGWSDFRASPTHLVVLSLVYPVVGLLFARVASGANALPLVYPLVAGFALLGPIAAVGLYDLSRQREMGGTVRWLDAFSVLRSPRLGAIVMVGGVLVALFVAWMVTAQVIYRLTMPAGSDATVGVFVQAVLHTDAGWALIGLGTASGFCFAAAVLVLGAFSIPMLVDRGIGGAMDREAAFALATSLRAARRNPLAVATWGVVVAVGLMLGAGTMLVGFAVVMPVLGHATWHLYRRVVAA